MELVSSRRRLPPQALLIRRRVIVGCGWIAAVGLFELRNLRKGADFKDGRFGHLGTTEMDRIEFPFPVSCAISASCCHISRLLIAREVWIGESRLLEQQARKNTSEPLRFHYRRRFRSTENPFLLSVPSSETGDIMIFVQLGSG